MPVFIVKNEFNAKCERIHVTSERGTLDDIFVCYHQDKGFLFARNQSVEYFEIPEQEAARESASETESGK